MANLIGLHLETIHTKAIQLDAMVSVLRAHVGNPESDVISHEVLGNYAWIMTDLLEEIQEEIRLAREVDHA